MLQHRRFFFTLPTLGLCTFSFSQKKEQQQQHLELFFAAVVVAMRYSSKRKILSKMFMNTRVTVIYSNEAHTHIKAIEQMRSMKMVRERSWRKKVENKERKREWEEKKKGTEKERKTDGQTDGVHGIGWKFAQHSSHCANIKQQQSLSPRCFSLSRSVGLGRCSLLVNSLLVFSVF